MSSFLGCLFIFIFGIFLLGYGLLRSFFNILFGGVPKNNGWGQRARNGSPFGESSRSQSSSTSGNAHHEGTHANSRQRRSQKIFEKNEGEYVDFEEV